MQSESSKLRFYVVMPVYNEERYLERCLSSVFNQTQIPDKLVIVDDNSSDNSSEIASNFASRYDWVVLVKTDSEQKHLPGSKVINAFNYGLSFLDDNYDVVVKLDSDLILPEDYFQEVIEVFLNDSKVGMVGGQAYIEKDRGLILESLTDNDHIRGAFKSYRKSCFKDIGGLKSAMGWDTIDELLSRYYGWKVVVNQKLKVIHLKPTGNQYNKNSNVVQGEAFYDLGYGFIITFIASLKLAYKKQNLLLFISYLKGYFYAKKSRKPQLVTPDQAKFVRAYRWQKIRDKVFK